MVSRCGCNRLQSCPVVDILMHSSVNPRHRQWPDDSDPSVSTVLGNNCVKKAHQVGYFLDESNGWSMDMDHLTERLETARS
jgi:hypothetical protein